MPKKSKKSLKAKRKEAGEGSIAAFGKELQEAAAPVVRLVNSPIVSELIAAALVAGAGALAKSGRVERAIESVEREVGALVDSSGQATDRGADFMGMVAYSVAVAAGEVASRLAAAYENEVGSSETAERVAKAARQAAETAWQAFGKR